MKRQVLLIMMWVFCSAFFVSAAERSVVEFWFGEPQDMYTAAIDIIIADFEAQNPQIKINRTRTDFPAALNDPFMVSVAGGVPPDIIYTDGHKIQEYYLTEGMIMPISDYVTPDKLAALKWLPGMEQTYAYNGKWYGLPFRTGAYGLYSNQDLVAQAGLPTQTGPKTVTELDQWAQKLSIQNADGTYKQIGFMPRGNNWLGELGWFHVFGGKLFDWKSKSSKFADVPAHINALTWMQDYAIRYGWNAITTAQNNFFANKVAFRLESTTRLTTFPELMPTLNFWVTPVPRTEAQGHVSYAPSLGTAIPLGARNPQAAAQFMLYLSRADVQAQWYRLVRQIPTNMQGLQMIARDIKDPKEQSLVDVLPTGSFGPPPLLDVIRKLFTDLHLKMLKGELAPRAVLEQLDATLQPEYKALFKN